MPRIDFWYGSRQRFGHLGCPQRWLNILGRVSGQQPIRLLSYRLDGGDPQPLSLGPDGRRLVARGDFNIELDAQELPAGLHDVVVTAVDEQGGEARAHMQVDYVRGAQWPLPYTIDWAAVNEISSAVQIVDGRWQITPAGVVPLEIGYDRLLAIGDTTWRDYEIRVPITVHGINPACFHTASTHSGAGVVMRFRGHASWPSDGRANGQPRFGYLPFGAIGWFTRWHAEGGIINFFDTECRRVVAMPRELLLNTTYILKARVETQTAAASIYSLKLWRQDEPEPERWELQAPGSWMSLERGALFLVAHETAATFGNLSVIPLEPQ